MKAAQFLGGWSLVFIGAALHWVGVQDWWLLPVIFGALGVWVGMD